MRPGFNLSTVFLKFFICYDIIKIWRKKKKTKIPLIIAAAIAVIIVIIVLVVLFGFGAKKEGSEPLKEIPTIAQEIYGFSAIIKKIEGKTLILEADIPGADPQEAPIKKTVKAVVTDNTKIVKWQFPKTLPSEPGKRINAKEIPINFETLKVGDKIDVGAFDNISENIKNGTEFKLKHIFIIEK